MVPRPCETTSRHDPERLNASTKVVTQVPWSTMSYEVASKSGRRQFQLALGHESSPRFLIVDPRSYPYRCCILFHTSQLILHFHKRSKAFVAGFVLGRG